MGEDYIRKGAIGALLVVVSLIALGALPAYSVGGVSLRHINILSQLITTPQSEREESLIKEREEVELVLNEEEYVVDLESAARKAEEAREMMELRVSETSGGYVLDEEDVDNEVDSIDMVPTMEERYFGDDVILTPIENFDTLPQNALRRVYRKLSTKGCTTRIAVLGDSFIEGDILTADLREALQMRYGGSGSGFTPMASPLTKFRRTIKTDSRGWESYNIMQRKSAPEKYADSWMVSGWVCSPNSDGSSVRWECTDNRERLDSCQCVRLLFVSREASEVSVFINGAEAKHFSFEGSEMLQQIEIEHEWIRSCEMRIESGTSGFVGYGACFESDGVVVDNYSIRSNNGQAMLWTNPALNVQMDGLVGGYDLVILQYGLNILQRGVRNYENYATQIGKMISFARLCYPRAAILVMGVSDRSMRDGGEYKPVVEATDMIDYQRDAAAESGAAFWNTHAAMGAQGGMKEFVIRGWAAKDFTHINFEGGRQIGRALAEAINVARHEAFPPVIKQPTIEPIAQRDDKLLRGLLECAVSRRDRDLEREMARVVHPETKRRGRLKVW